MSYVLDIRELVHKLPFHHFSATTLASSCVMIACTYAAPCLALALVATHYFRSYTLKNRTVFENTNVKEHKTRGIITLCVVVAFAPAALVGLGSGFAGGARTLRKIEGWANEAQSGLKTIAPPMMAMDDALTMLRAQARAASDVGGVATVNAALAAVTNALVHDGGRDEFNGDLDGLKWTRTLRMVSVISCTTFVIAIGLLLFNAALPIAVHHGKTPVSKWWKTRPGGFTPEFFVRACPVITIVYCFIVTAFYWPVSVIGAEVCFAYEQVVEFQVPENLQLYMVCPRFGYELGEYLQNLHADKTTIDSTLANVEAMGGAYATSTHMETLKAAKSSFDASCAEIFRGLGDCQPLSDTIELATSQVCDEVILGLQMITALTFGLACLLMYGTMHRWFGSDVAKELVGDEEQSLYSALTKDELNVSSKYGKTVKTEGDGTKSLKKEKKKRAKKERSHSMPLESGRSRAASSGSSSGDDAAPAASETTAKQNESATSSVAQSQSESESEFGEEPNVLSVLARGEGSDPETSPTRARPAAVELRDPLNDDGVASARTQGASRGAPLDAFTERRNLE